MMKSTFNFNADQLRQRLSDIQWAFELKTMDIMDRTNARLDAVSARTKTALDAEMKAQAKNIVTPF